jgi:hypothetical protein
MQVPRHFINDTIWALTLLPALDVSQMTLLDKALISLADKLRRIMPGEGSCPPEAASLQALPPFRILKNYRHLVCQRLRGARFEIFCGIPAHLMKYWNIRYNRRAPARHSLKDGKTESLLQRGKTERGGSIV